jgi:hypothetical protein
MAEQKQDNDKIIKDAQYRKGLSIAFFNATNAAISLIGTIQPTTDPDYYKTRLVEIRDWLLEEHKTYYATVIANVGVNFNPEDTIKKLKATTDKQSFKSVWLSLSEDERHHEEVKKVAKELKDKYKNAI